MTETPPTPAPIPFRAETRQLLEILIHSLYTEHEIFLRELISNASDALTRLDFELLTNRDVLDPHADLAIRIIPDKENGTLTIDDTGLGMTAEEMTANLGTIARSGAREFISAAKIRDQEEGSTPHRSLSDLIGQFGVGFYSAFMVADEIRVTSRSHRLEAQAATWYSTGNDTFMVEPAEKAARGTSVTLKLKEDAKEFLEEYRLREIIRKHSDFIPFPIYVGKKPAEGEKNEQVNRQTAIWRQQPREVEKKAYDDFYQQFTFDFEAPLVHAHMVVDAPVQMYSLLYIPAQTDQGLYSMRREPGLKLYARKVLIQDYNKDLLPEYLSFVTGVVDSEDIPLNVSRETVQASRVMAQLKKLITNKVLDTLQKLSQDDTPTYEKFWGLYGRYLKQGVAVEAKEPEPLPPLLRFHTLQKPDHLSSLDEYLGELKEGQKEIYYILGEDEHSVIYSPHLDVIRKLGYDVLIMADPVDAFMLMQFHQYKEHPLTNVATANLELPDETEAAKADVSKALPEAEHAGLIEKFKTQLGERVLDVRMTHRLADSPARLVDPEGAMKEEMQRVYRILNREFEAPKKVLELNPRHPILSRLGLLMPEDPRTALVIEQIYEDALLIEGLHPDPASMIGRIQKLMEQALT